MRALASSALFARWPGPALKRLVRSSHTSRHPRGALVVAGGRAADTLTFLLEGTLQASVTAPGGRRITFNVSSLGVFGMLPLLDGRGSPTDLIAVEPVTVLWIPHSAIRAELAREPALWESVALEAGARARACFEQMKQFVFDEPRLRMATLLLSLAQTHGDPKAGRILIGLRLPQDRLAEMLGVSRQWTTTLVGEMTRTGIIEWRYGRVTILDLPALRAITAEGVNASN